MCKTSDQLIKLSDIHLKHLFINIIIATFVITSLLISNTFASDCSIQQYECADKSQCIPLSWRCDGDSDCPDGSDESQCAVKKCTENEFKCQNGKCLPIKWICDNEDDCGDRSDERNCANHTCAENHFKCVANSNCIPEEWVCDDTEDCSDGSDEKDCKTELVSCRQNEFTCDNGKCLINRWLCDGENDCGDGSDESPHICANKTCSTGMFTCHNGKCIPDRWKCDGDRDCHGGEDEEDCPQNRTKEEDTICGQSEFLCHNGHECINKLWRCDRSKDCTDGSDEFECDYKCGKEEFMCRNGSVACIPLHLKCNGAKDCSDGSDEDSSCETTTQPSTTPSTIVCTAAQYQCKNRIPTKCLEMNQLCDGKNDCGDWSDEPRDCGVNECEGSHHCSHICVNDLSGYHCECKKGYKLSNDNKTCDDIDECAEDFSQCSGHMCLNLKGHFKCECFDGYEVRDHRFCKVKGDEKPLLMFANRHDIRTLDISQKHDHQHYNSLYSDLSSTISVDYSLKDNYLIWSDVADETIFIAPFDSKHQTFNNVSKPKALISNRGVVDALAVDWVHRLVYWTDTFKDNIEVANISNPEHRTVIVSEGLEEPRGIAVNVLESWIVWTDWGSSQPKIERSLQDGSHRQVLVDKDIVWPNGVTIDMITKRIYWLDAKLNSISAIDYDGLNRILILHSSTYIRHPFSLDIFEDTIYWTDWELESVLATNKFGNGFKVDALVGGVFSVMDIRVVHSYKKPNTHNRCSEHRCSHLCLPTGPHSYRCSCPTTMTLKDNRTCEPNEKPTTLATTRASVIEWTPESEAPQSLPFTTPSYEKSTKSLEEIELEKSHNKNKIKHFNDRNQNQTTDTSFGEQSDGKLALMIFLILLSISLIISGLTLFIYRKYQRRNITSMNFDNPVYRKTTEEQFALEKSDDSMSSYPSSLEPLTSPGTNEFV